MTRSKPSQAGTVTVIIPTFNRSPCLPRALDSVLAQTFQPVEVIVVDDGSDDGTAALVKRSYPQVSYLHQARRGVSAARNQGIRNSTGTWLAFLDSDDTWLPDKLAIQLEALRRNPDLHICHTDEIWIRRGRRVNPARKHAKRGGWIFRDCLPLCCISPSSVIIHRSVFDQVGLFDESLPVCEDYDLWLRITARFPVLYVAEKLTVKYGGHRDQLSRKYWGMDRFRIRALEKILESGILSAEQEGAARAALGEKLRIYLAGARKRKKWAEVEHYENLRRRLATTTDVAAPSGAGLTIIGPAPGEDRPEPVEDSTVPAPVAAVPVSNGAVAVGPKTVSERADTDTPSVWKNPSPSEKFSARAEAVLTSIGKIGAPNRTLPVEDSTFPAQAGKVDQ